MLLTHEYGILLVRSGVWEGLGEIRFEIDPCSSRGERKFNVYKNVPFHKFQNFGQIAEHFTLSHYQWEAGEGMLGGKF